MPSGLLSNFFFLQMGKLRSRERQLVVEEGLEFRSPNSQDGQQHDAEKRNFRARALIFYSFSTNAEPCRFKPAISLL